MQTVEKSNILYLFIWTDRFRNGIFLLREVLLIARTKEFNEDQALHQAMLLFWKKGYEATSIPDLLQVMGISRSSLYDTFSDKQALYIAALEHYRKVNYDKQVILERASNVREGIRQFFEQHIASAYDTSLPGGCFVTNAATTLESPDEKINELIKTSFLNLEQAFCELLEKGQQSGEIDKNTDIQALSYLLLNLHQSINVMAKIGQDQQRAMNMINFVIAGM
ncbi:TetR/AcrR family transcriptional regulator [Paenibacillus azoreducens]|uniref:TetR/AcrR family transcriptional regulator n=1 Tax=Paenibacillus azoreducens TaxID=116718 RepID=UPI001F30F5D8|nr:TetR/AcrR family transcriptional regulator [Paenibacillus azoreducens]